MLISKWKIKFNTTIINLIFITRIMTSIIIRITNTINLKRFNSFHIFIYEIISNTKLIIIPIMKVPDI